MTEAWLVVGVTGAATVTIKALGPVLFGGRHLPPRIGSMLALLGPALLAALVVTQVFGDGEALTVDERTIGLAAAGIAVAFRAPALLVVVVAGAATALVRLLL